MGKKQVHATDASEIPHISLSQAILAPLLSIFKAQVHAARSFLSFLLQIGTPHIPADGEEEMPLPTGGESLYMQTFHLKHTNNQGKEETVEIKIPSLALVPIAPLGVESAEFEFDFRVENYHRHRQMQRSEEQMLEKERDKGFDAHYRPWYLVDNPINFDGNVAPSATAESASSAGQVIKIKIRVSRQPTSAGLDKLLTSFNQYISVTTKESSQE